MAFVQILPRGGQHDIEPYRENLNLAKAIPMLAPGTPPTRYLGYICCLSDRTHSTQVLYCGRSAGSMWFASLVQRARVY